MVTLAPMDSVLCATKNTYRGRTAAAGGGRSSPPVVSMGSGVEVPSSQQAVTPQVSEPEESVLPQAQASSLPLQNLCPLHRLKTQREQNF
ncbi:unnamed protein product [Staurois parvus]|uniref:Uncharacterized protein n=1 Tax=Staurois parvus TaxID=386267 RepID=A0ABN9ALB6_9NEOB|nr:unnamed protein product [Staurois parvus]